MKTSSLMTRDIVGYKQYRGMDAKGAKFLTKNQSLFHLVCVQTVRKVLLTGGGTAFWRISPNVSARKQRNVKDQTICRMRISQRNPSQAITSRKRHQTITLMQPSFSEVVRMFFVFFFNFLVFSPVAFLHLPAFQKMGDALFQNHPT